MKSLRDSRTCSGRGGRTKLHRRNGQALLETSMCILFILMPMLTGIVEFGWLVHHNLILANASREGARVASVGRPTAQVQLRTTNAANLVEVIFATKSTDPTYPLSNLEYSSGTTTPMSWNAWTSGTPADSGGYNGVPVGNSIRVTARIRHKPIVGFLPPVFAFFRTRSISQQTIMRRENNG